MAWYTHTAGVFSDAVRDNSVDDLDTELESLDTTLAVLKTGYINLGLMESYDLSAGDYPFGVAPIYGYPPEHAGGTIDERDQVTIYRQFDKNAVLAVDVPYIAKDVEIPEDAAVTTTCTVRYIYSATPAAIYKVSFMMAKRAAGETHHHHTSVITPVSLTVAISRTYYEGTVTTPAVSAGDILQIQFYRDGQTAGDTGTTFAIHNMTLEYTRTA